ncbi:RNA helicase [Cyanobium sp. FGCU-52]|nr:RNA helicase [Cyanobium sp. FGCU52]
MDGYDNDRSAYPRSDFRSEGRRGTRREGDPLEERLDRWVSAGRQFVEGVSGARPGSRGGSRGAGSRPGGRPGAGAFRPADLGRWVEDKLDRLLEDDGDDWREPWQEPAAAPAASAPPVRASARRPLEAISRRGLRGPGPEPAASPAPADDWPADEAFTLPRWQRPAAAPTELPPADPQPPGGRPLPRSSRRR